MTARKTRNPIPGQLASKLWAREKAGAMGSQYQLWPILTELFDLEATEGQSEDAVETQAAALEVIQYLAEHMDHEDLKETFLDLPRVQAVISL